MIHLRNALDKFVGLFCILVFLTFMINHGHIDFSGVDWVRRTVTEAVKSPDGQECIEETKDISKGIFISILHALDRLVNGNEEKNKEES
ncbi:hypothetical protein [Butyrivibrio sp. AC2005]|uniref:hypothetical protein n=1 Tax=Butyrivibrio sp. AC2005 TaxID=1280672 RepID=UPI003FA43188